MATILYVTDGISPWVIGGMQAVARRHLGWLTDAGHHVVAVASRAEMPGDVEFAKRLITLTWPARSMIGKLSPWSYVLQLIAFSEAVSRVAQDVAPDLVYSEGPLIDDYLISDPRYRAPVIFHPHGLEMFQNSGSALSNARVRPMRPLIRRHIVGADATISQGGRLDKILTKQAGGWGERIAYLPNCTPAGFRFAKTPRRRQTGRFLFVGRNELRKGLTELLTAMASLPQASLDIVGAMAGDAKVPKNVTFHGPIRDRDALRAVFDEADFLVLPSHAEGMPTVILEAFSAALPVIATDVGAVSALVKNGSTGYLVPRAHLEALTVALRCAADLSPAEYEQMSCQALELAKTEFSPVRVRQMLLGIVERTLRSSECAGARQRHGRPVQLDSYNPSEKSS